MMRYFRNSLAFLFFAACICVLALWWRSMSQQDIYHGPVVIFPNRAGLMELSKGSVLALLWSAEESQPHLSKVVHDSMPFDGPPRPTIADLPGEFGRNGNAFYFPLWYPAIIFTLAGVAALRFRRQLSIRTGLVVVSVVAALLGMVVVL